MDQKVYAYAVRQADNKRRMDNNLRNDHVQQPPYKRLDKARAYTARPGEKKEYAGTLPMCNKYKYHHTRPCTAKCGNCKRNGHQTKTLACFECGEQGHYRSECPELKNQNLENQDGSSEARKRVYAFGGGETNQDPCNIVDDIDA
nr:reverse transcriptase domain-containing protein [Tanacetum cinerariifolium]